MPDPLERYFQRLNPIMFPSRTSPTGTNRIRLDDAWNRFSRQLFDQGERQLNRSRVYINALARLADRGG